MNRLIIEPSLFNRYYDDKIQKIVRDFKNNSEISSNYFPAVDVIEKDNSINIEVKENLVSLKEGLNYGKILILIM